jgi:hypothetical protein
VGGVWRRDLGGDLRRIPRPVGGWLVSIQVGYHISTGRFAGFGIWEPWFYLGAVLFALSTWQSRRMRLSG